MQTLHLFDLDFTLWKTNSKVALINKNKPEEVVMRIDPSDKSLMETYWKKYELSINYNGQTYYLSDKFWEKIKKSRPELGLEDLGLSYREWTNEEELNKQQSNIEYLLQHLDHLIGDKNITLGVLTARTDKPEHRELLEELYKKIDHKLKVKVNRTYFVNNLENKVKDDITASKKAKKILEHLIGYHIKNNRFVSVKQTPFKDVHFYDDYSKNIEAVNNIQKILENCLSRTKPEIARDIMKRLEDNELMVYTHQVTNNKENPFIESSVDLRIPSNFRLFK